MTAHNRKKIRPDDVLFRYCLHPGPAESEKKRGPFIDWPELMELYGVPREQCHVFGDNIERWTEVGLIHLHPLPQDATAEDYRAWLRKVEKGLLYSRTGKRLLASGRLQIKEKACLDVNSSAMNSAPASASSEGTKE